MPKYTKKKKPRTTKRKPEQIDKERLSKIICKTSEQIRTLNIKC